MCLFQIWPLPLVFVGNLLCGLGGTKKLRYVFNTKFYVHLNDQKQDQITQKSHM